MEADKNEVENLDDNAFQLYYFMQSFVAYYDLIF